MRRVNIGMIAALFLLTQMAISNAAPLRIDDVTGDDAPDTIISWVDRIDFDAGVIIIGDISYQLSKDTAYFSEKDKPVDKDSFTADMTVRYLAEDRKMLAIWHISDPDGDYRPNQENRVKAEAKPEITPRVSDPSALDGVLKKKNGVWTN